MGKLLYESKQILAETATARVVGSNRLAKPTESDGSAPPSIAGDPHSQTFIERLRLTKRYLDAGEVVGILGVHITTLQLWTKHREIPHLKVGHAIRFDPVELADWLSSRQIGTR